MYRNKNFTNYWRADEFPGRTGVKFSCSLPASAYLTMVLRELKKSPVERGDD